jgi:hypothetical protein
MSSTATSASAATVTTLKIVSIKDTNNGSVSTTDDRTTWVFRSAAWPPA